MIHRGARFALCVSSVLAIVPAAACAHEGSAAPSRASARASLPRAWVTTWATSVYEDDPDEARPIADQTVRQIARVSLGGARVRVRVSNAFGKQPLRIGAAHVAMHARGGAIVLGSDRTLRFGGAPRAVVPPGALLVSDPVALDVPPLGELAISLYVPDSLAATTVHGSSANTAYWSKRHGDVTGAAAFDADTVACSYYLAAVEVEAPGEARTIVALGDSITDGMKSTQDAHRTWPDALAARLHADVGGPLRAVVNAGISGNRVFDELVGPSALVRLDRDVLAVPGAAYVVFVEGLNDLATEPPDVAPDPDRLIASQRQVIERTHARGMKIVGGTLPPFEGSKVLQFTAASEAARQKVNAWVRSSGAFDAYVDFDHVLADPTRPTRLLPGYDSGDHAHPNDTGYQALADAVDLALFR
jgi:lysophospholipase L1-like esterase